jgi:hypothetical protein
MGGFMELTKEHIDEIVLAAQGIEYGKVTISIAGDPSRVVDIITERRTRFGQNVPTGTTGEKYPKDKYQ